MQKWLYPLLIAFAAFLIFSSPAQAGAQTRTFAGWLGDLAGAAGEFLDGLFTEDANTDDTGILQPNTDDSGITVPDDGGTDGGTAPAPDPGTGDGSDDFGLVRSPLAV